MARDDSAVGEIRVTTDGTDAYVSVDGADPSSTKVYVRALGETAFSLIGWDGATSAILSSFTATSAMNGDFPVPS